MRIITNRDFMGLALLLACAINVQSCTSEDQRIQISKNASYISSPRLGSSSVFLQDQKFFAFDIQNRSFQRGDLITTLYPCKHRKLRVCYITSTGFGFFFSYNNEDLVLKTDSGLVYSLGYNKLDHNNQETMVTVTLKEKGEFIKLYTYLIRDGSGVVEIGISNSRLNPSEPYVWDGRSKKLFADL